MWMSLMFSSVTWLKGRSSFLFFSTLSLAAHCTIKHKVCVYFNCLLVRRTFTQRGSYQLPPSQVWSTWAIRSLKSWHTIALFCSEPRVTVSVCVQRRCVFSIYNKTTQTCTENRHTQIKLTCVVITQKQYTHTHNNLNMSVNTSLLYVCVCLAERSEWVTVLKNCTGASRTQAGLDLTFNPSTTSEMRGYLELRGLRSKLYTVVCGDKVYLYKNTEVQCVCVCVVLYIVQQRGSFLNSLINTVHLNLCICGT